jgi:predicted dehydrogenase
MLFYVTGGPLIPRFPFDLRYHPAARKSLVPRKSAPPLRVAVVGLVHGHVDGFFQHNLHRSDVEIVGVSDPSRSLFDKYAKQFSLDPKLYFASLDDMLIRTHPQAVLVYTSTYDHRAVVEAAARRGVHVMMEKPLAVSYADAEAIAAAAKRGKLRAGELRNHLVSQQSRCLRSGAG